MEPAISLRISLCGPGWSVVAQARFPAASNSWAQTILPPQPPALVARTTDARHHPQLVFVFLVETEFRHVAQAWSKMKCFDEEICGPKSATSFQHGSFSQCRLGAQKLTQIWAAVSTGAWNAWETEPPIQLKGRGQRQGATPTKQAI
ncbi:hypothetical protein AAY473_033441 [Plecturocebus cupreus]